MVSHQASNNTSHGSSLQINGPVYGNVGSATDLQPSFFKTSNYKSYKDFNPERVSGTCVWFLEHPTFKKWKDSNSNDLLWLSADPGCGKSVLSRALIDEKLVGAEPLTLCYFFFKDNDDQNNIATALCALLHQFFRSHNNLLEKYALSAVKNCGQRLKDEFEELWQLFISAATDPSAGDVICILDALDECRQFDRDKLINYLERFYIRLSDTPKQRFKLKFFVTSRPYYDIERRFAKLTRAIPTIRLAGEDESGKISYEIGIVMKSRIEAIAQDLQLDKGVQSSLHGRLQQIPNRTYLWLHLILNEVEISLGKTKNKLQQVLDTLAVTVEDAYEKILTGCKGKEAKRILQIIVAARRPLTLDEIDVALEIQTDPGSQSRCYVDLDLEGAVNRKRMIRESCGLFVNVVDSRVYLIHQTAREFLVQKNSEASELRGWKQSIDLQEAHRVLSKLCIVCLLFREIQEYRKSQEYRNFREHGEYEEFLAKFGLENASLEYLQSLESQSNLTFACEVYAKKYAFLRYSAEHWISHVQEAHIENHEWVSKAAELCDMSEDMTSVWFWIYSASGHVQYALAHFSKPSALYNAVLFGLLNETRFLLKSSSHSNTPNSDFAEAFKIAAATSDRRGKELMAIFLEERGDEVKITEEVVKAAVRYSRKDIIALLLEQGGDEVKITEEVVKTAVRNGGKDVIAFLLEQRGDEVKITEEVVKTAVRNGGKDVIAFLLEQRGDEVKITEEVVKTAVRYSRKDIIALLLEQGGDEVKITEEVVKTAVRNGGKDVIAFLLEQGGDEVKITEEVVKTAVRDGGKDVIAFLLEQRGDEVKITEEVVKEAVRDDRGRELMEFLIQQEADKFVMSDGLKAQIARSLGEDKVGLLLERRGDHAVEIVEEVSRTLGWNPRDIEIEQVSPILFRANLHGRRIYLRPEGNVRELAVRLCQEVAAKRSSSNRN